MPKSSADKVQQRVAALKKKITSAGEKLAADARRQVQKRLKRAQRKRRRLVVAAKRAVGKAAEAASA